jgi:hypothetical protein
MPSSPKEQKYSTYLENLVFRVKDDLRMEDISVEQISMVIDDLAMMQMEYDITILSSLYRDVMDDEYPDNPPDSDHSISK